MTVRAVTGIARGGGRIVELDPRHDRRWEAFVAAHPDGLIYHHPAWLGVLEEVYGYEPICLACEAPEGQLRGILPLVHTRGLITGRGLVSLPRTPVAGPLALEQRDAAALVRAAVERVRGEPGARLQLRAPAAQLDGIVADGAGSPWELTYLLELAERPEGLRFGSSRNHARIRWAVNKAARQGVRVRPAETEGELRSWYQLYLDTMRWHAVPPRPYRFFRVCWDRLRPRGLFRLLLAEQGEAGRSRLLAGSILLMFGQTVYYAFNGRRRGELSLRPNDAIQWRAIHDACRDGFRRYDFGAVVEDDHGLAEFKAKWGAGPRWVHRYAYPVARGAERGASRLGRPARRLANAAWRRLPLQVTALLGNYLYTHL